MMKTTDGGLTWQQLKIKGVVALGRRIADLAIGFNTLSANVLRFYGDSTVCLGSPTPPDSNILSDLRYEGGDLWVSDTTLHRTSDYGSHWATVHGPYDGSRINRFAFGYGGVCILATQNTIYRSTDFGATWTLRRGNTPGAVTGLDVPTNAGDVVAVTDQGHAIVSRDNGLTWPAIVVVPGPYRPLFCVHSAVVAGKVCVVMAGEAGTIYRSTDTCRTWQLVNSSPGVPSLLDLTYNGANWFAVGGHMIWTGSQDASIWTPLPFTNLRFGFSSVTFADRDTGYVVGGYY